MFQSHWVKERITYDGSQLRPLYGYLQFGVLGDSIIGWRGPCDIPKSHIVDGEDLRSNSEIRGSDMLHFIIELFGADLYSAVCFQRLCVSIAADIVQRKQNSLQLLRKGDDLYLQDKKFNISIASKSNISSMVHIAFNVSTEGTPVPTLGLRDLGIDADEFAKEFMESVTYEFEGIWRAQRKVRPL